jgi:restriction endonuclease Mrr
MPRTLLEDEDGYHFEDIMMDVFRNLGYRNVRNPSKSDDMGRDIVMEKENQSGEEITYVAECKHFSNTKVGRPIIQKLDSACRTYDSNNKKQGMVITTNKFSRQAKEYAEDVGIKLMNGDDIRELADEAGLDIYNGNVEIVTRKAVPFRTDKQNLREEVVEEFEKVENFQREFLDDHKFHLELIPFIELRSEIYSTYESDSVGVVNKIKGNTTVYERADDVDRHQDHAESIYRKSDDIVHVQEDRLEDVFHNLDFKRFGFSEGEYRKEHKQKIAENNKQQVSYTAGNNVTYDKTHEPDPEEVEVTRFNPVYIPKLRVETEVMEYSYTIEYFTNEDEKIKVENEAKKDVGTESKAWRPAMCPYCGSINKKRKLKTERIERKPICKHCSIKDRYWLAARYFKDEENHQKFNELFENMETSEKLLENKVWIGSAAIALITAVSFAITSLV